MWSPLLAALTETIECRIQSEGTRGQYKLVYEGVLVFVAVLMYVMFNLMDPSQSQLPNWWGPLSKGVGVFCIWMCTCICCCTSVCHETQCDNSSNLVGSVEQGKVGEQLFIFFKAELVQCLGSIIMKVCRWARNCCWNLIANKTITSDWWLWYDDYHLRLRNCRAAKNSKDCDEPAHPHPLLALFIFPNCLSIRIFRNIWRPHLSHVPFLCRRCLPIMTFILVTNEGKCS